jgi:iron complex transport system substrate-binding protein
LRGFEVWRRLTAGCALVVLLGGCGNKPAVVPPRPSPTATIAATAKSGPRTVTDQLGRTVSVPETVTNVVALSASAADLARALGLEVVGRTTDTPAEAAPSAKTVGSNSSPDFNAVAALNPDLVIADAAYQAGRTRDFDRFAFPVFVFKDGTYDEQLAALTALGDATGRSDAAASARQAIETHTASLVAKARDAGASKPAPKVLILTGGGRDVFGGGANTYLGSMVALLQGTNVYTPSADGGPIAGFGVIDIGQAATLNPDVVLVLSSGTGGLVAQIKSDARWANTPAVKQGHVFDVDTGLFLRAPGARAVAAGDALYLLLWP